MYYAYSDYLGSILTLTDNTGAIAAKQNFDAWGRYRNPDDWTYNNVPARPEWLYRGFTGHEHLKEFALINMNGRMYDPIQGRMLSPDNHVPLPWNTQGYNRYSYANNNPLVYVDPDGNFAFVPILIAAAIGAGTSAAIYSVTAIANGNWSWGGFFKSAAMGAVAGGIGGGIAQIGVSLGAAAQSIGLNIISNVGAQVGTNLAFGNNITWGMLAGSIAGGFVSHGFGNFNGVNGGALANIGAEIGFNAVKYGVSGGIGGALGAAIDGTDIGQGFLNGAKYGAIGGATIAGLNIATMGATYIPDEEYGDFFGRYTPVYRTGTFLTRAIFGPGSGVTIGRNLVTHQLNKNGHYFSEDGIPIDPIKFNHYLRAHETGHYAQETGYGFGRFYLKTLGDYLKYGMKATYSTPGTLEYGAQFYSFYYSLGYYFDSQSHLRTSFP